MCVCVCNEQATRFKIRERKTEMSFVKMNINYDIKCFMDVRILDETKNIGKMREYNQVEHGYNFRNAMS